MRLRWTAGPLMLGVCAAFGPGLVAQEAPATEVDEPTPAEAKLPFALYLEVDTGTVDADSIDTSLTTLSTHVATTTLTLDGQTHARAAIGWKLPHDKGDFRLVFNGFSEEEYSLESTGSTSVLDPALGSALPDVNEPLRWWRLSIDDGVLRAERTPPQFTPADDANGNGFVDDGEQTYFAPDLTVVQGVPSDLENRAQTWDLLYGRVFGNRRATARWWGGVRYFVYEGTLPTTGWLSGSGAAPGVGYSDGALIPLLTLRQDSSSIGPTGAMEVRFHFFDERLSLFLGGQAAFMVLDVSLETGPFATYLVESGDTAPLIPVDAELEKSLSKSSWQTGADVGVRFGFRNGLQLEAAYGITGFLDALLIPTNITIPASAAEAQFETSALYKTKDYVLDGWRAGVSFQF